MGIIRNVLIFTIFTISSFSHANEPISISTNEKSSVLERVFAGELNNGVANMVYSRGIQALSPNRTSATMTYIVSHHLKCGANTLNSPVGLTNILVTYENDWGIEKEVSRSVGKELILDKPLVSLWNAAVGRHNTMAFAANTEDRYRLKLLFENNISYADNFIDRYGCRSKELKQLQENLIRYSTNRESLQAEYQSQSKLTVDVKNVCDSYIEKEGSASKITKGGCVCLARTGFNNREALNTVVREATPSLSNLINIALMSNKFPEAVGCFKGGENYAANRKRTLLDHHTNERYFQYLNEMNMLGGNFQGYRALDNPICKEGLRKTAKELDGFEACSFYGSRSLDRKIDKTMKEVFKKIKGTKYPNRCSVGFDMGNKNIGMVKKCNAINYGLITRDELRLYHLAREKSKDNGECPAYSDESLDKERLINEPTIARHGMLLYFSVVLRSVFLWNGEKPEDYIHLDVCKEELFKTKFLTDATDDKSAVDTQVDDTTIASRITIAISSEKAIEEQSNISVQVFNGRVLLVGQAPTQALIQQAGKLTSSVKHIKKLYNQIRLGSPISASVVANDAWLASKVKAQLVADKRLDGLNIQIEVENGEVFLMGLVSKQESNIVVDNTRNIKGVKQVIKAFEYT